VGRLLFPGGLGAASRHAGAEPLVTGRARPFDESILRRSARAMSTNGGVEIVARHVAAGAEREVRKSGEKAVGFTDLYDQVLFTKKPAHAGPIGGMGNRILAATYFALTCIRVGEEGPTLFYRLSWHKPASPLVDGLKALYQDPARQAWLLANLWLHNWDRGGNGKPVLEWALGLGIPYLTISGREVYFSRYHRPTLMTEDDLPVFVRPEEELNLPGGMAGPKPYRVIYPAAPEKATTRALEYLTAATLSPEQHATMNEVYKWRWPEMENQIKAILAVGFGINRDRTLTLTTSRGTDGDVVRLLAKETELRAAVQEKQKEGTRQAEKQAQKKEEKLKRVRAKRAAIERKVPTKGSRTATGCEMLCKNLLLLLLNALTIVLAKSPVAEVRAMTPWMAHELLFGQPCLACSEVSQTTLWITGITQANQRVAQQELVRLFNDMLLTSRGLPLRLRLRDSSARSIA
jgi:hypothetical protein